MMIPNPSLRAQVVHVSDVRQASVRIVAFQQFALYIWDRRVVKDQPHGPEACRAVKCGGDEAGFGGQPGAAGVEAGSRGGGADGYGNTSERGKEEPAEFDHRRRIG